jgi:preprotein translocase subunit SecB
MNCIKRDIEDISEGDKGVKILLQRDVRLISEDKVELILHSKVGIPNGLFEFDIVYKGYCEKNIEMSKPQFEQYAYDQVVPLLLPYVRECISSTMARMGIPIFTLPTIDVLDSLEANKKIEENQE